MKHVELQTMLAAAMTGRSLVRISRNVDPDGTDGYVVDTSEHWLLLLLIGNGVTYEGFQAFRLRDITSLEVPSPRAAFYEAALRKRGLRRPRTPKLNLASTQELICSAAKRFPLVGIHREKAQPDFYEIGKVIAASAASVSLLRVTPDATWDDGPTAYRLAQITRVDFGGPYEEALALVAGTPDSSIKRPSTVEVVKD